MCAQDEELDVGRLVDQRWGRFLSEAGEEVARHYLTGTVMPRSLIRTAGKIGIQGLSFPKEVGGAGADTATWGRALEEVTYRCGELSLPLLLSTSASVADTLLKVGHADLTEEYVVPLITGERAASLAFSEDSDAISMRTTIRRQGNEYRISGHKDYVTGGLVADVLLTYARDESGYIVGCLVETSDPGVELSAAGGIGFRAGGMARLTLHDTPVPARRVIAADDGLTHAQLYLNGRRLAIACLATGVTRALLQRCQARLRTAIRNGQPVLAQPSVQGAIGRMHIATEASRALLHRALTYTAQGQANPVFDPMISAAKHFATEQALFAINQALRLLGGHGYYGDDFYGGYLRDSVALLCAAGAQDLLEINIGALVANAPVPVHSERHSGS